MSGSRVHQRTAGDLPMLVVEDEPALLAEVVEYLQRRGEYVISAASFTEATRILADGTQKISALIVDATMPDGNGIDLIRTMLARCQGRCRCILMTGQLHEFGQDELRRAGVTIMHKPFAPALLHHELRDAVGG